MSPKTVQKRKTRTWLPVLVIVAAWLVPGMPHAWSEDAAPAADAAATAPAETPAAAPEAAPAEAPAEGENTEGEAAEGETDEGKPRIDGSFSNQFDGVWADGESDMDLEQTLSLNVQPGKSDKLRLRGLLWMQEDLDSDEAQYSALRGINDSYDSDVRARLLHLYAEVKDVWGQSTLRIGRQQILEGIAYNRIDGLYFNKRCNYWEWYAFAGVRASLYEDSSDDASLGAGVTLRPRPGTQASVDFFYGEEEYEAWEGASNQLLSGLVLTPVSRKVDYETDNSAVALSVMQDLWTGATAYGRVTWLDGNGQELLLDLTGVVDCWGLAYELRYRRQMDSIGERVSDLTGFSSIMGVYDEYDDLLLVLTKDIGKKVSLSLEAELHDSRNEDLLGGNRDYQRLALVGAVDELFPTIDAELSLERWHVDGGEGTWALTGELSKTWKALTLTVGADYEQYQDRIAVYDGSLDSLAQLGMLVAPGQISSLAPISPLSAPWILETHEEVHSLFGKARWVVCKNQEFTASIRYEEDEAPESPYWRVRAGYLVRF